MHKSIFSVFLALLASVSFGIGASQEWVKNYFNTAAPTANIIDSVNAILNAKNDDEIKVTKDGQILFTTLECVNGIYTNVTHYLTPSSAQWIKGTYHGVIITSSTDPVHKRGEIFALVYDKYDGSTYYVNGEDRQLEVKTIEKDGATHLWVGDLGWEGETPLTSKRCVVENKDAKGNTTSYFVLEPFLMFEETWKSLVPEDYNFTHDPSTIPWANDAVAAERKLEMVCTYGMPMRRMMMRSAGLPEQPTAIVIKFRSFPAAEYVDTIEYAAAWGYMVDIDGKLELPTKENCWAEPTEIIPQHLWHQVECWIDCEGDTLKPSQVVTVYVKSEYDGLYYPQEKKIRSLTALKNLLAQYPDSFPPFAWPSFTLTAKTDCRKTGDHIFGENCECIVCGHQREHKFFDAKDEFRCSRCENEFDEYTTNWRGEKKKKGKTTGQICGITPKQAGGDVSELALHSGWWHQSIDGDTTYNCSCECGFYSTNKDGHRLAHEYDPDAVPVWRKANNKGEMDGIHHFAYSSCVRCKDALKEIKERHELEIPEGERDNGSAEPYNTEFHHADGVCKICSFGENDDETAFILEEHAFHTDSDNPCFCRLCNQEIHSWQLFVCGSKMNQKCERCGKLDDTGVDSANKGHEYGKPLSEGHEKYFTHHACHCGFGELEPHNFVNGKCTVCGAGQMPQVKCASKRNRNGNSSKTDEHMANCDNLGGFFCNDYDEDLGIVPDGSEGNCPYCGGNFFTDYPEAKKYADKAAKWTMEIKGGEKDTKQTGESTTLTGALFTLSAQFKAVNNADYFKGNAISVKIFFNPTATKTHEFNFPFLGTGVKTIALGDGFAECAEYRGIIIDHPKHGTVISWE